MAVLVSWAPTTQRCRVADLDLNGEVEMSDVMLLIHMLVQSAPIGP